MNVFTNEFLETHLKYWSQKIKWIFLGSLERGTRVVTRLLLCGHAHHLIRGETRDHKVTVQPLGNILPLTSRFYSSKLKIRGNKLHVQYKLNINTARLFKMLI